MAKKPDDTQSRKEAAPENAADAVRTKQETDTETKRRPEASTPAKPHPKLHRVEDEGPIEDTSVEPFVEDEP